MNAVCGSITSSAYSFTGPTLSRGSTGKRSMVSRRVRRNAPSAPTGWNRAAITREDSSPAASARSNSGSSASGTCGSTTVVIPTEVAIRMLARIFR